MAFPSNATLAAGEFKVVWLDGEPDETDMDEWHTSFRVAPLAGSLALVRSNVTGPMILDYLNYRLPTAGRSYGDYPDGDVSQRQAFYYTTPGATNNPAPRPSGCSSTNGWRTTR